VQAPRIYLDHTSTAPLAPDVWAAMEPYVRERWYSPGALYRAGRGMKRELEDARRRAADALGVQPNDVIFTSSGTESINLAIRGVAQASQHRGRHIITSQIEHRAVLDTTKQLEKQGWSVTYVPVDAACIVDVEQLDAALDDETALVSIMLANNEVGSIQPLQEIIRRVKAGHPSVPVHSDVIAAAGYLPLDLSSLGADLVSLSSHKLGGPKGAGLLWMKRGTLLQPAITGDDRERGRRAGQEDVPAIMGMVRALELALPAAEERAESVGALSTRLIEGMEAIPGATLTGHPVERAPQIVSFCFERIDGEALLQQLDIQGIAAASGSACTSATLEPSHVLKAMGVPAALAEGNLRLSLGVENTEEDVATVLDILPKIIDRMRSLRT
jgi:cysteine desulfurase